jgi:hypothetical protein
MEEPPPDTEPELAPLTTVVSEEFALISYESVATLNVLCVVLITSAAIPSVASAEANVTRD